MIGVVDILRLLPDKLYLQIQYYKHFRKFINWKNPKGFNEKLQWLKVNDRNPLYTVMVDKAKVKKYVADRIGDEYIIPTYKTWRAVSEINFSELPDQFVLKWNHDSGSIVICSDKSKLDYSDALKKLRPGAIRNGYWYGREWPYKDVEPLIIAEMYLDSGDDKFGLTDYKFYCFNGRVEYLYVSRGLGTVHNDAEMSFFTRNWEKAPFGRNDFNPLSVEPKKPHNFELMIELAEEISRGIPFIRVDLYEVNKRIYFSELTLYPCSGLMPFEPEHYDEELGELIRLPREK